MTFYSDAVRIARVHQRSPARRSLIITRLSPASQVGFAQIFLRRFDGGYSDPPKMYPHWIRSPAKGELALRTCSLGVKAKSARFPDAYSKVLRAIVPCRVKTISSRRVSEFASTIADDDSFLSRIAQERAVA